MKLWNGSHADLNNYRPISILPTLSKIMEKHVHDSFIMYLNNYKLLCESQSGFRNCSCAYDRQMARCLKWR